MFINKKLYKFDKQFYIHIYKLNCKTVFISIADYLIV